jgi:uncharacterized protein
MDFEPDKEKPVLPIEIAISQLPAETVLQIIDSFIMREGTDYGSHEVEHEKKQQQILAQLKSGKIKLLYDPNTESVTLMTALDFQKLIRSTTTDR